MSKTNNNSIGRIIGIISNIVLGVFKSIWNATIHIVWGMVTIFLLGALMTYYNIDTTTITALLELCNFLMSNWVAFWWVFFALEIFPEINKLNLGTKNE